MRYTVHAEWPGVGTDISCASTTEAVSRASHLVAAGATGVYVYDDFQDRVYWPDHFTKLMPLGVPSKPGPALASGVCLPRVMARLK
jgi:hypothetical protein